MASVSSIAGAHDICTSNPVASAAARTQRSKAQHVRTQCPRRFPVGHVELTDVGVTQRCYREVSISAAAVARNLKRPANIAPLQPFKGAIPSYFACDHSLHQNIQRKGRERHSKSKIAATSCLSLLAPRTRSRPVTGRTRKGEGRWSRPSKIALEQRDLTEKSEIR